MLERLPRLLAQGQHVGIFCSLNAWQSMRPSKKEGTRQVKSQVSKVGAFILSQFAQQLRRSLKHVSCRILCRRQI
jgi:hypothetical protein